jgi:hypothetical protein
VNNMLRTNRKTKNQTGLKKVNGIKLIENEMHCRDIIAERIKHLRKKQGNLVAQQEIINVRKESEITARILNNPSKRMQRRAKELLLKLHKPIPPK